MNRATHAVYVYYPYTMTFARTPFEGSKDEMLEIAEELQNLALDNEEKGMYLVRPLPEEPTVEGSSD